MKSRTGKQRISGNSMSRQTRSFTLALVSVALLSVLTAAEAQTVLQISVDTDQSQYLLGEKVVASVEACNPTDSTVSEYFQCPCGRDQFQVYDEPGSTLIAYSDYGPWCLPWACEVELDPGECRVIATWEWSQRAGGFPLPGDGTQVNPGIYLMVANYIGTTTEPAEFEILSAQQATPVPTLGTIGFVLLALAIGLCGAILMWRSSRVPHETS